MILKNVRASVNSVFGASIIPSIDEVAQHLESILEGKDYTEIGLFYVLNRNESKYSPTIYSYAEKIADSIWKRSLSETMIDRSPINSDWNE